MVEELGDALDGCLQDFCLCLDLIEIVASHHFLHTRDGCFDRLLLVVRNLVSQFTELFFSLVDHVLCNVACLDHILGLLVSLCMLFGLPFGAIDLFFRQSARTGDGDLLFFACAFVLGGDVENAVGVNVEGNLNLRDSTSGQGDTVQSERSKALVVTSHGALTLKNIDFNRGLVVRVS